MSLPGGNIVVELSLDDKNFSVNVKNAGNVLRQLQGTLNQTATSVKKLEDAQLSLGTRFRDLVLTLGNLRFVAMDINDVFLRLPVSIAKSAGELERLQVMLSGLSKAMTKAGKDAEAASEFKFITDLAQNAPFRLSAISDAFVKLKTAGLDPARGSMQALIDGVAKFGGDGETLKRASIAIQQMMGKGVVSMEELRQQLGEAVPNAMQYMAEGMGMTMADLTKKVSKGTVEAGDAVNKMLVIMQMRSEDAASTMMKTWVGMTEQMHTRLELAAKEISEAGFGKALKDVAAQFGDALNSQEFKRFTDQLGQGLGTGVRDLAAFTKVLVENRDTIVTLTEAWLAYKAASVFIGPTLQAAGAAILKTADTMKVSITAARESATFDREYTIQQAANALYRVEAVQQELTAKQALYERELESVRVRNAAIVLEDQRMAAQLAALQAAERATNANNIGQQQSLLRYRDELAQKNTELLAREQELTRAVNDGRVALSSASAAAREKAQHLAEVAAQSGIAAGAITGMKSAANMAAAAFNFLGGWTTVLNIAIMAGIALWANWGKAAQEAQQRADRALKRLSDQKDLEAAMKDLDAARARKSDADAAVRAQSEGGVGHYNRQAYEAALQQQKAAQDDIDRLTSEVNKHRETVESNGARDMANAIVRGYQIQKEARDLAVQKTIADEDAAFEKEKSSKEKNLAAMQQLAKEHGERLKAIRLKQQQDNAAALRQAIDKLAPDLKSSDTQVSHAAAQARQQLEQQLDALNNQIGMTQRAMQPNKDAVGKEEKPARPSKIQEFIDKLKSDHASLEAELDGLQMTIGHVDKVKAAYDKVISQWHSGKFKQTSKNKDGHYVTTDATQRQAQQAAQLAAQNARMKQTADDAQKVSAEIDQLGPRYAEALQILADPLGTSGTGKEVDHVNKLLAEIEKDPERMKALADKFGRSFADIKKQMVNQAETVDDTGAYQKMVSETKTLNDALVSDDRLAAKQRALADDDRHRRVMQNMIDELRARTGDNALADKMQADLEANTAARAATTAQRFKSPIEKMADQWKDSTRNMEEATAHWAESGTDALAQFVVTGKADFKGLVQSILIDMAKIEIKKRTSGWVDTALNAAVSYFTGGSSVNMGTTSGAQMDVATSGMNTYAHAKGGIMSSMGPVPLRKYAAGGIATSPQLALFGEGSMNEAYVPLPDGRRIPVNMQGGAAPAVTVNVINQSGQSVDAKQGKARFDGKQVILDVVLTAANQAGPFRDGMKSALK